MNRSLLLYSASKPNLSFQAPSVLADGAFCVQENFVGILTFSPIKYIVYLAICESLAPRSAHPVYTDPDE